MQSQAFEMFGSRRIASGHGVEEARRVLSEVFLPVDFPSAKPRNAVDLTLNAAAVGGIVCGFMRFGDAVRVRTAEARDFHVDIPISGVATMRAALGTPVRGTPTTAAVFMPGRPVELDCSDRFSQLALMIPRDQLRLELENLLGEPAGRPLEFTAQLNLAGTGGLTIMHALRMVDGAAAQEDGPLTHPLATQRLEQIIIQSLLFGQPHNYSALLAAPSPTGGSRPVSRAVELMRSDPGHPWTVAELAADVSLSVRSLQEGFRRSLDTTPMTYLRRLRLDKVHHELSTAGPGTVSVTEVATRWGFVHLGRFAGEYARAFGEHPSATLRQRRGLPRHA
ncbi:AraC family transcriptional regulator [Leifsonia sp. NPDC080035]|uniref:AraC family transcriptional regulator n=1 Tax=Leifsonia sp. NPDC080035 TaxID=3143936 RepID=A0AAU7GE49_9MICO